MVQGRRVPESYCNYYLGNGIVIVPQFGYRSTDSAALGILQEQYPDRVIIPIDASDFIIGLGAFPLRNPTAACRLAGPSDIRSFKLTEVSFRP
jgi:agmatine/peptidylarginine deiminase